MVFCRPSSANTLYKVVMHPFSMRDLIEVSLTSGTVTIGFFDIILVYIYWLLLVALSVQSIVGLYILSGAEDCVSSNPLAFYTYVASCAGPLLYVVVLKSVSIYYLPLGPIEYTRMALGNLWGAIKA